MAIDKEIKDYIDSLIKNLQVDTLAVGSYDEKAQIGSRAQGSQVAKNTLISGINNQAKADHSAAIGSNNEVGDQANSAIALGEGSIAGSKYQLVQGKYNDPDYNNVYAQIVGGGEAPDLRKNIYTLDWEGNAEFAGTVKVNGDEVVSKQYLTKNIPIKLYPYNNKNNNINICINDLEAYTIYKADISGEFNRIKFYVKNDQGREIEFLSTDSMINKYNMFVAAKTDDIAVLHIGATVYELNLHTGKLTVSTDTSYSVSGGGSAEVNPSDLIDDDTIDKNKTWSSLKLSEITDELSEALDKTYNGAELYIDKDCCNLDGAAFLIFYKDGKEIDRISLPAGMMIVEDDIELWNTVEDKIPMPLDDLLNIATGEIGQVLAIKEIYEDERHVPQIKTEWVNKDDVEVHIITREEIEELVNMFPIVEVDPSIPKFEPDEE